MAEECRNCRFSKTPDASLNGYRPDGLLCRRYPPPVQNGQFAPEPRVHPQGWCGEWLKMRPAGQDAPADPRGTPPTGGTAGSTLVGRREVVR